MCNIRVLRGESLSCIKWGVEFIAAREVSPLLIKGVAVHSVC